MKKLVLMMTLALGFAAFSFAQTTPAKTETKTDAPKVTKSEANSDNATTGSTETKKECSKSDKACSKGSTCCKNKGAATSSSTEGTQSTTGTATTEEKKECTKKAGEKSCCKGKKS